MKLIHPIILILWMIEAAVATWVALYQNASGELGALIVGYGLLAYIAGATNR